jgi:hypothetical protein
MFGLVGMGWGIAMAASQDHSAMPAHAHLNLLGWVSLFLFGIYYRLHPATDVGRIAVAQVALWGVGTVVMTIGVAAIHAGRTGGDPIAAVGSFIIVASMLLFAVLVFRPAMADRSPRPSVLAPAE